MENSSQLLTVYVKGDPKQWIEQWKKDHPDMHIHQISIDINRVEIRYAKRRYEGLR